MSESIGVLLQSSSNILSGLLVKEGVVSMSSSGRIQVPVINASPRSVTLSKHTVFADVNVPDKLTRVTELDLQRDSPLDEIYVGPVPGL